MSSNTSWDSLEWEQLNFSYDKSQAKLSSDPRFVDGSNSWVTLGGTLCKRPGTTNVAGTLIAGGKRIDRLWIYETTETPPQVYLVASMYDTLFPNWGLYYTQADVSSSWIPFTNLRNIQQSTRAHEGVVSRGIFYGKGFPEAGQDTIGTVAFDGSDDNDSIPIRYWGLEAPTVPAALVGAVTTVFTDINSSATALSVTTTVSTPTPFFIQMDDEQSTVTSKGTGTDWTIVRGVNGTTAAAHVEGTLVVYRNWSASSHQVTVNISWAYTYAYKSISGHVSNRAPLETNPDKLPSRTGPFQDLIPKFVVQGIADTTLIPTIIIFRSTDGGGTYYELEEITNTGAGAIIYEDNNFESGISGGVFNDPIPDNLLDQGTKAPTLTSNSIPPTVLPPEVSGVDTPINSTPIAYYSSRLWYGLGNVLFYSGDEEITLGIPEESWPSGLAGNFFRFQYQIINVAATTSALYVFTVQTIYEVTGNNKETFNVRPIFENYGAPYGHPRAVTNYEDSLIFLAQDFRIIRIKDTQAEIISDPLGNDIQDAAEDGLEIDIKFWSNLDKEWIVVAAWDIADPDNSRQWIFDIKKSKIETKPFWSTPWTIPATAMASGRPSPDTTTQRDLLFALYEPDIYYSVVNKIDTTDTIASDELVSSEQGYDFNVVTNLFLVPAGNHVNKLRVPGITANVYAIALDRLLFSGDSDPKISYYKDDLWTYQITPNIIEEPARRDPSKGYKTMIFGIDEVAQHIAVQISKLTSEELFKCENLIITYNPDGGI